LALPGKLGCAWALATFEIVAMALLVTVVSLGSEQKGKSFTSECSVRRIQPKELETHSLKPEAWSLETALFVMRLEHRRREQQNSNHPENPKGQGSHDKDRHDTPPLCHCAAR
jgi:hypothetical protein